MPITRTTESNHIFGSKTPPLQISAYATVTIVFAYGTFFFKFYYATQYYQALTFTSFSILIRLEYEYFLKKRTIFRKQLGVLKHNTVE